MINVTDKAKRTLKRILADSVDWPGARLRLMDRGQGQLGLGVDIEAEGDKVVHCDGLIVLIVAPDLAANLKQVTLDAEDTADGSELIIIE
jgi:Fe-S cluster assembly iron-binding protein IscA